MFFSSFPDFVGLYFEQLEATKTIPKMEQIGLSKDRGFCKKIWNKWSTSWTPPNSPWSFKEDVTLPFFSLKLSHLKAKDRIFALVVAPLLAWEKPLQVMLVKQLFTAQFKPFLC